MTIRRATHACSWYSADARQLDAQMDSWGESAESHEVVAPHAIITPHAGYRYSGQTAVSAFKSISKSKPKLVVIFGPSHYKSLLNRCGLTMMNAFETPFENLSIDTNLVSSLLSHGSELFMPLSREDDEAEHSIEMQLPLISKYLSNDNLLILPIIVGHLSTSEVIKASAEILISGLREHYAPSEKIVFIISSDFCHYGARFQYAPIFPDSGQLLWMNIKQMDLEGFESLSKSTDDFEKYLEATGNTICGRYPILLFIHLAKLYGMKGRWRLLNYDQSNEAEGPDDSSVSYLSAVYYEK